MLSCTQANSKHTALKKREDLELLYATQHNTFEALLGCTPLGYISFLSDLCTGNVSDRKITMNCGFLDMNELFHNIMADQEFCIRVALALKLATLNIPPFTSQGRLASKGATKTRRIA
ncbi:hypothetical protein LSH36_316g07096 [Paralvinella palmiformis]|uniref:DDE Tnp4 domain-containing protein n=1 Tax=Paralvinella palmiformis TaxID=53620 RepID=A0AAD9JGT4_9ANNE|nr:hypothetical protein LSH36_316g07096 [Paralvinella palmiformis]